MKTACAQAVSHFYASSRPRKPPGSSRVQQGSTPVPIVINDAKRLDRERCMPDRTLVTFSEKRGTGLVR